MLIELNYHSMMVIYAPELFSDDKAKMALTKPSDGPLLPLVVADSASSFYVTKINKKFGPLDMKTCLCVSCGVLSLYIRSYVPSIFGLCMFISEKFFIHSFFFYYTV
jgi:hypothetical protein